VHFVHVSYFTGSGRVARTVQYLSHREEHLPEGAKREIFGIGERYRALRGDEPAIVRQLREDGARLQRPRYFRWRLTVPDAIAERLARFGVRGAEQALRDAIDKTFRGAFRHAQGMFVVHHHGAGERPFGNPHVHALLSPVTDLGTTYWVPKARLEQVKTRWEREALASLSRLERRRSPEREPAPSPRPSLEESPQRPRTPGTDALRPQQGPRAPAPDAARAAGAIDRHGKRPAGRSHARPERAAEPQEMPFDVERPRRIGEKTRVPRLPTRTLVQMARDADQPGRSGERRARRVVFRLLTPALPRELRTAFVLARTVIRVGGGDEE
jgi:hypothetical protein